MGRIGSPQGIPHRATILKTYDDGTVQVALDEVGYQDALSVRANFAADWFGPSGEFSGGYPARGTSVLMQQGQGGEWFIIRNIPSDNIFIDTTTASFSSVGSDVMSAFQPGRHLTQVSDGTHLFLDPNIGIQAGHADKFLHINPNNSIISDNFDSSLHFTESIRVIQQTIKRDLSENSNRNVLGSTLDDQSYDQTLFTIGMDPSSYTSPTTTGNNLRNLPLIENRTLIYEFASSYNFTSDQDESTRYTDPNNAIPPLAVSRRNMRSDALSLSLVAPNQLIEKIEGTAVDAFGNILDINFSALPIGQINELSLSQNADKSDAFNKIRQQLRKSLAYVFEVNARKGTADPTDLIVPNVLDTTDYARNESKFILAIDKEGQFKLNVPASSETGNLSLLTRHTNYSNLLNTSDSTVDPSAFVKSITGQEIFLKSFATNPTIMLSSSEAASDGYAGLDGYASPIDYITDTNILFGTAFHDIAETCHESLKTADYLTNGLLLINFDPDHHLNTDFVPLPQIVSPTLIVSGPDANCGGRSATINLDGMLVMNVGANTVDRQSIWLDSAGGIVANVGRDLQNISSALSFDGDLFLEIGGVGIGNTYDSRFATQNDAIRNGTLDIKVYNSGQLSILRIGPTGIDIITPGKMVFSCDMDMIFRCNGKMAFEAPEIMLHAESSKRIVNKFPANSI